MGPGPLTASRCERAAAERFAANAVHLDGAIVIHALPSRFPRAAFDSRSRTPR